MHIVHIKYLEHNGEKFYEGDKVYITRTGLPDIVGEIETLSPAPSEDTMWLRIRGGLAGKGSLAHISIANITNIRKQNPVCKK